MIAEIVNIFKQALKESSPRICVEKALNVKNDRLIVNGREYVLNGNVRIVAAGKAAVEMVTGAENALKDHLRDGIASIPIGSNLPNLSKTKFYESAKHNLPDNLSIQNTQKILDFIDLDNTDKENILFIFLISGGASAVLCSPSDGISLEDKLKVIRLLASNGADITALNTVRIALSKIKGGRLAQRISPSKAISFIISDIVGGKIDKVGSGPTVEQKIDLAEAKAVLENHNVWKEVPESVKSVLEAKKEDETPSQYVDIQNILLCDNRTLLDHFKQLLESNGIETTVINSELEGNASEVGEKFAEPIFRWIDGQNMIDPPFNVKHLDRSKTKRFAWLYGGETTVRFPANLPNSNPKGGRNQEMVLSVLNKLRQNLPSQQHPKRTFYFASFGTDGQDGPTDATGAIISNNHLYSSDNIMGQICDYLHYKDSYTFWSIFRNGECLVKINKTGNNLMDVQLLLFEDK